MALPQKRKADFELSEEERTQAHVGPQTSGASAAAAAATSSASVSSSSSAATLQHAASAASTPAALKTIPLAFHPAFVHRIRTWHEQVHSYGTRKSDASAAGLVQRFKLSSDEAAELFNQLEEQLAQAGSTAPAAAAALSSTATLLVRIFHSLFSVDTEECYTSALAQLKNRFGFERKEVLSALGLTRLEWPLCKPKWKVGLADLGCPCEDVDNACCSCRKYWRSSDVTAFFENHPEHVGSLSAATRCPHLKLAGWSCPECLFGSDGQREMESEELQGRIGIIADGQGWVLPIFRCSGDDCLNLTCASCEAQCHRCAGYEVASHLCASCGPKDLYTYRKEGAKPRALCDECAKWHDYDVRSGGVEGCVPRIVRRWQVDSDSEEETHERYGSDEEEGEFGEDSEEQEEDMEE